MLTMPTHRSQGCGSDPAVHVQRQPDSDCERWGTVPRVPNIVVQQRLTFCQSDWTFKYHGAAYGSVIADEREDGLAPWQGTELGIQLPRTG
jgi:hypothetical protein